MSEPKYHLAYDCCRCTGQDCSVRETCLRYRAESPDGRRIPFANFGTGPDCGHRIELPKEQG